MFIFKSQYYKIIAYIFDIIILFLSVYSEEIEINNTLLYILQIIVKVSAILYQELLITHKIHPDVYSKEALPKYFSYTLIHPFYHLIKVCKKSCNLNEINRFLKFLCKKTLGFYIAILYIMITTSLFIWDRKNYKEVELDVLIIVIFMTGYYYDVLSEYISLYEYDDLMNKNNIPIPLAQLPIPEMV